MMVGMREDDLALGLDVERPNIARVYDYWLGGKDNFAADRELAALLAKMYPPWVQACRDNRAFVERSVTWAAEEGIGQFLDLGAGLPSHPSVHEAARAVNPVSHDDRVNHGRDEVLSFLGGLDVVPPGLALAAAWRAGTDTVPDEPPGPAYVPGAVAVKRPM